MEKRYAASSLVIKDQLIITGGSNNHSRLKTSEIISDHLEIGKFEDLPELVFYHSALNINLVLSLELGKLEDLPYLVFYHSALNINNTFSMITGGKIKKSYTCSLNTYYFNHKTQKWTPGPKLIKERYGHTAGIVADRDTNENHVVVVGGKNGFEILDSIEILKEGAQQWSHGKDY